MVLLDISATGEENLIEQQSGDPMNHLEYRQTTSAIAGSRYRSGRLGGGGISIADLTLNDFRIDLSGYLRDHLALLKRSPFGTFAVTTTQGDGEAAIRRG